MDTFAETSLISTKDLALLPSEVAAVKAALTVSDNSEERMKFLTNWFQCHLAQRIAADPFRRGTFARDAGMTPRELGAWNRYCAREDAVKRVTAWLGEEETSG